MPRSSRLRPFSPPPTFPRAHPSPSQHPQAKPPRDATGLIFGVLLVQYSTCLAFYVYSRTVPDPYDAHVWVLQRSSDNYNGGQWENLSQRIAPITSQNKAFFMFSDRIDRDQGTGTKLCRYRVVDMGSYSP